VDHLRGTAIVKPAPGPFHCIACRSYVTGTPSGHCPRCGFVPPVAPLAHERHPRASWVLVLAVVLCLLMMLYVMY